MSLPRDHEPYILAAVLLAQRAQAGEDVSEATKQLAELAGRPDEEEDGEEPSTFAEWDESKHHRDHGRFAHTAGASDTTAEERPTLLSHGLAALPPVAKLEQMASDMITGKGPPPSGPLGKALAHTTAWVGHALHKVEHAAVLIPKLAAQAIADDIDNVVAALPAPIQERVREGWLDLKMGGAAVGKVGLRAAFANWEAMQVVAQRVAEEKGASLEDAKKIRAALSAVDMKTFEVLKVAALAGVHAAHAPLSVTFVAPPATTAYLAYNASAHPLATIQAAAGAIKDVIAAGVTGVKKLAAPAKKTGGPPPRTARLGGPEELSRFAEGDMNDPADPADPRALERARAVADALEAHGYDDWYLALFLSALDQTGNTTDAIAVANEAYRRQPTDPSRPADAGV